METVYLLLIAEAVFNIVVSAILLCMVDKGSRIAGRNEGRKEGYETAFEEARKQLRRSSGAEQKGEA